MVRDIFLITSEEEGNSQFQNGFFSLRPYFQQSELHYESMIEDELYQESK